MIKAVKKARGAEATGKMKEKRVPKKKFKRREWRLLPGQSKLATRKEREKTKKSKEGNR